MLSIYYTSGPSIVPDIYIVVPVFRYVYSTRDTDSSATDVFSFSPVWCAAVCGVVVPVGAIAPVSLAGAHSTGTMGGPRCIGTVGGGAALLSPFM